MIEPHEARTQFGAPVIPLPRHRAPRAAVHGPTYAQVATLERAAFALNGISSIPHRPQCSETKRAEMLALLAVKPMTIAALQEAMQIAKSTATYLRNDLESAGYARRVKRGSVAAFVIEITHAGIEKLANQVNP